MGSSKALATLLIALDANAAWIISISMRLNSLFVFIAVVVVDSFEESYVDCT